MGLLFARLGRLGSPAAKRKIIENVIWNWAVKGKAKRTAVQNDKVWFPSFITMSPTMRCNLKCTGCYSGLYTKDGELSEEEMDRVLHESRSYGNHFSVISGGEPYLLKDKLLRLFHKYDDMLFLTFTNATLLDDEVVAELARLGNVMPAISVEGYEEQTDERRGAGVHAKVLEAMARLKRAGVIFGISVTYTSQNIDTVTSDEFIRYYMEQGAMFAWYFMFMPVGKDPILELVPTPEQRVYTGERVAELRRQYPLFMADFWNDGPAARGCLAGGRQYLHILNSGRIEPCVFAHFGVDNIREKTIMEAVNSPFFRAIRERFPYNEEGNLRRPCMIIDNPEVLREVVDTYMVPEGHKHSEDLIHDPKVVAWIDEYAAAFKALVDPVWEEETSDPSHRWYRGGKEFKDLFRFHRKSEKRRNRERETESTGEDRDLDEGIKESVAKTEAVSAEARAAGEVATKRCRRGVEEVAGEART
jgi:MoaA/NifB/PqqE/SkfB family radical SAM enzyme